ncbi:MAG: hypothetical protein OSA98_23665, partial [Rubripirellula sp.]|nr:hypothetical protein [Rubripirellula sp.]
TAGESDRVEQQVQDAGAEDAGADDVVARRKELLKQEIVQSMVSPAGQVSWGRLAVLAALVVALIAVASVVGR